MASPAAATDGRIEQIRLAPRRSSRPADRQHRDGQHQTRPPTFCRLARRPFTTASPNSHRPPQRLHGDRGRRGPVGTDLDLLPRASTAERHQRHDCCAPLASRPVRPRCARPRRGLLTEPASKRRRPACKMAVLKADLEAAHGCSRSPGRRPARTPPAACEATSMRKFPTASSQPELRRTIRKAAVGGHDHRGGGTLLARRGEGDPDRS